MPRPERCAGPWPRGVPGDAGRAAVNTAGDGVMEWLEANEAALPEEVAMQRCMFDIKWAPLARRLAA